MKMKYVCDTGWLDGCTCGEIYDVEQCKNRPEAYIVLKNDLGGISNLMKDKFIEVKEGEDAVENTVKLETNDFEKIKEVIVETINLIKETANVMIKLVAKVINKVYSLYHFNKKYSKLFRLAYSKKKRIAKKNRKRLVKLIKDERLFEDGELNEKP